MNKCECGCGSSCRSRFVHGHTRRKPRRPMRDHGDHVEIDAAGRGWIKVDKADAELASSFWWAVSGPGYPTTKVDGEVVYLHRFLLGLVKGDRVQVDHVNQDKLDNRRANLRVCDNRLNRQNGRSLGGTSKFRGVAWNRRRGRWEAYASLNGRKHFLGRFDDEVAAAEAASEFRAAHMPFSEDARKEVLA